METPFLGNKFSSKTFLLIEFFVWKRTVHGQIYYLGFKAIIEWISINLLANFVIELMKSRRTFTIEPPTAKNSCN